jgi:haloacid dehalogenase superfamily, subfamily IA, variant 3 with third motif having DD or ED
MRKKINSQNFKAVLFDMDGVIVDSMSYHFIAWFEALRDYGVRATPDDIFKMEGAKWHDVSKYLFRRHKKKLTVSLEKEIFKKKDIYFRKYFKRYIFTEIPDILRFVKNNGFLTGLVTGSNFSEAKKMLPRKIFDYFDVKVAGDMVKRGKPYPDPYLLASKMLNVKPSECFVVENAPYGIKSAKSAKMYCGAIETSLSKEFLSLADIVFDSHKEFLKFIKQLK